MYMHNPYFMQPQPQSMDDWYQQQRYLEEQKKQSMEVQTAYQKAWATASVKDAAEDRSFQRKEYYEERKYKRNQERKEKQRALAEMVKIDGEGRLTIVTENLSVAAIPRTFTNMQKPVLDELIRLSNPEEIIFRVQCTVGVKNTTVFLEQAKVGRPSYLTKKFMEHGITFYVPNSKMHYFTHQLFALLCQSDHDKRYLPDKPGWIKLSNKKWIFWKEDRLTWKALQKKI